MLLYQKRLHLDFDGSFFVVVGDRLIAQLNAEIVQCVLVFRLDVELSVSLGLLVGEARGFGEFEPSEPEADS